MTEDMHEHRRHADIEDDGRSHRLQQMAESSVALVGGRLVTPILLVICIGLIGWIGSGFQASLEKQGDDIAQVKSDVRVINTRLDAQVIRQVEANTKVNERQEDALGDINRRVDRLEGVVRTP